MIKRITCIALTLILISCENGDKKTNNPLLPTDKNPIEFKVGDSWLYKRYFINEGIREILNVPDTLVGYSYFEISKDTLIDSLEYLVVEGKDYEISMETIDVYKRRMAYHISDSLITEYEFRESDFGFLSGLMKRQNTEVTKTWRNNYSTVYCKNLTLAKILKSTDYDTSVFRDFTFPIRFPLVLNEPFVYRPEGDPSGNGYYRKMYTGQEEIRTDAGQFQCYVLEYLVKEALSVDDIIFTDYVSNKGLVKRYMNTGMNTFEVSIDSTSDSLQGYDIMFYIGTEDINPDTLIPWGQR